MENSLRYNALLLALLFVPLAVDAESKDAQTRFRGLPWQTSYPTVMAIEGDDYVDRGETHLFYRRQTPAGAALVLYVFSEDQRKLIRGELWFRGQNRVSVIESLRDRLGSPGNSTKALNGKDDLWWQVEDTYVLATDSVPADEELENGDPFRVVFLDYNYPHDGLEDIEESQAE